MLTPSEKVNLPRTYGTRQVSLSYGKTKTFEVEGAIFSFWVVECPVRRKPILNSSIILPDGTTDGADMFVLLVKGHKPVKDIPFGADGRLAVPTNHFVHSTRLAVRSFNKPRQRRKRIQELRLTQTQWHGEVDHV